MYSWIFAIVVFYFTRSFVASILAFWIGRMIDSGSRNGGARTFHRPFGPPHRVSPEDFELHLLSLASLVIKADGQISQTELDYVRNYFVRAYGKDRANATFRLFNEITKTREINAANITNILRQRTRYESRLQIIHFLFSIADADGRVSELEMRKINEISNYLGISYPDFESIKAMFFQDADSAYKILEVDKNATDNQIKQAYRSMAKKYHPDKLQHLDEAHRRGGEEKFKKVQDAYAQIRKERGF
ncbi:MAG: molecular chaperone DjiA [Bacteroidetes bacterium]|jgi:DnaJ like chaperone protein|nr:molecular chaperone DjiA [Bacteroidota bacterium]